MKRITFLLVLISILNSVNSSKLKAQYLKSDPPQYGEAYENLPDRRDVSIYQVNMRAFSETGDFQGVIARLDSIKALGFNVVYLMPIYPVGQVKSVNSPYCIQDYTAINEEFGDLNDLRDLVEGAHKRGMAVILDWVANHTSYDHAWTRNKSWYLQDSLGNIVSPPKMGWNDVAQLNFSNQAMRQEMIKSMKYWILTANIDGFRCDYSDGPPFDFWKQALDTLNGIPGRDLLMLSEGRRRDHYTAGFDYNFGFRFFETMKDIYSHGRSVKSIDTLNVRDYDGAVDGQQIVRYTSNHDVNGSDGTPLELFGGEKGSMTAFMIVSYMKSTPMLYGGQEVGTPYRLVFPFTTRNIDWSLNPDITAEYKKIIAFRNASEAIRRGELQSYNSNDVCAFTKTSGAEKVLVLANMRNEKVSYELPRAISNSEWQDAFSGAARKLNARVELEAYSYLVLEQ